MTYPHVWGEAATLESAHKGSSLARFGDGELKICRGASAKSQRFDPGLSATLRRILLDTSGPCLPCIPRLFPPGPKEGFWAPFTGPPYTWLYNSKAEYGSSFITRPDSAPAIDNPAYWASVKALWLDRDVVLVRGSGKSLTADRLPGAASVMEIIGPVQHAWSEHKALFDRLKGEKRRVLLCLGATATALAWMLSYAGVHALDLGHVGMMTKRIGPDGTMGIAARNLKD